MFGLGKISKIPGSIASLFTVLILFILFHVIKISPNLMLFLIILVSIVAIFSINIFIKDYDDKDPKEVVIDEFIGQSILYVYMK